jgi:hypothetical protein
LGEYIFGELAVLNLYRCISIILGSWAPKQLQQAKDTLKNFLFERPRRLRSDTQSILKIILICSGLFGVPDSSLRDGNRAEVIAKARLLHSNTFSNSVVPKIPAILLEISAENTLCHICASKSKTDEIHNLTSANCTF